MKRRIIGGVIAALALLVTTGPAADASSKPHFIVHSRLVSSGHDKGWTRYDVQSSRHWAYDRVWMQCIAPGYESVGFVTLKRKVANKHGHAKFYMRTVKPRGRMRCRFYSPPAPGYPTEVSRVFWSPPYRG